MNAINTVWNLMLNKPYNDGGGEYGARIYKEGDEKHWDVRKQRTAAKILHGSLEDASQPAQQCCEIALAHSDTRPSAPVSSVLGPTPAVGASWRINFSRVENKGAINWVWSPQIVWSPKEGRPFGYVNMHLPDAWGYVVFADENGRLANGSDATEWFDPTFPARYAAMCLYYGAQTFRLEHEQRYPDSVEQLRTSGLLDGFELQGKCSASFKPQDGDQQGFVAVATANGYDATINQDRLIEVQPTTKRACGRSCGGSADTL